MIAKTKPGPIRGARRPGKQDGYAILLVAFLTVMMMLTAIVAAPSVRTERRREQEEEMIWRGKQYVHAIKLYYRKNGRFPTTIDDLSKPKNGSLRYLRQEYKDPMNKEDGKWRMIFVGPSGQLIGSTKPQQTIQISGGANVGTPAGQAGFGNQGPGQGNSQSAFGGSSFGSTNNNSSFGSQGGFGSQNNANPNGNNGQPNTNGAEGTTQNQDPNAPASGDSNQPKDVDTSSFVGGNIIGIGSKANHKSVIVYEKATNYHQFEFIWDPSKDTMGMGGTGTGAGTGAFGQNPGQGINGNNPNGSSFGGSSFGGSSFGQPSQNPNGNTPTMPPNGGQNPSSQPPPTQP
jgi:type II secretory pathway pseudopilin PulG